MNESLFERTTLSSLLFNHEAPRPQTVEEFYAQCRVHDWTSETSDDHKYWYAGRQNRARLQSLTVTNPQFKIVWNLFCQWNASDDRGDMPSLTVCLIHIDMARASK